MVCTINKSEYRCTKYVSNTGLICRRVCIFLTRFSAPYSLLGGCARAAASAGWDRTRWLAGRQATRFTISLIETTTFFVQQQHQRSMSSSSTTSSSSSTSPPLVSLGCCADAPTLLFRIINSLLVE